VQLAATHLPVTAKRKLSLISYGISSLAERRQLDRLAPLFLTGK
jgi:hypothetical protein